MITLNFKSFEEMVAYAEKITGGKTETIKEKPVKKTEVVEDVEVKTEVREEAKTFTLEEVRAVLAELTRSGKQKEIKELLASFGAKNLTSVDPKDYPALMEKAGEI